MGYTRFPHDIFLSYARADDEGEGWITQFDTRLRQALLQRGPKGITVWRDVRDLSGHQDIDSTIKEALDSAALFLALNSVQYPQSDYCRHELQYFLEKSERDGLGQRIGTANRWFNVLQYDIPHDQWLPELNNVAAYPFHRKSNNTTIGERLRPGTQPFDSRINELADALIKMLKEIGTQADTTDSVSDGRTSDPSAPPQDRFLLFVADVFDDLLPTRARLIEGLQQRGIHVMTNRAPQTQTLESRPTLEKIVALADLSIHLVNRNSDAAVREQLEAGVARARRSIVWIPTDWDLNAEQPGSAGRMVAAIETNVEQSSRCRVVRVSRREAPDALLDEASKLYQPWMRERNGALSPVFFDIHPKDWKYADAVFAYLEDRKIVPLSSRDDGELDPMRLSEFREKLLKARALVVFFGTVDRQWVKNRLLKALQVAMSADNGIKIWGVYEAPPPTDEKGNKRFELGVPLNLEWMDHVNGFNSKLFDELLNKMSAGVMS
jgi:TIR domain